MSWVKKVPMRKSSQLITLSVYGHVYEYLYLLLNWILFFSQGFIHTILFAKLCWQMRFNVSTNAYTFLCLRISGRKWFFGNYTIKGEKIQTRNVMYAWCNCRVSKKKATELSRTMSMKNYLLRKTKPTTVVSLFVLYFSRIQSVVIISNLRDNIF